MSRPASLFWTFFLIILKLGVNARTNPANNFPSIEKLIMSNGYPIQTYPDIPTEDNYLLNIYRIPHGKYRKGNGNAKNPVLLVHALYRTGLDYILLGPKKGLAYMLADRDYDVWLFNSRGTPYSRNHLTLDSDRNATYWDFSWHEIGHYDLPATIELMKSVTKRDRFSYIGYSQGTTAFYVLASTRPEYNRNISVMISLAPVAYVDRFDSPLLKFMFYNEPIWNALIDFCGPTTEPLFDFLRLLDKTVCRGQNFKTVCGKMLYLGGGYSPDQLDDTIITDILEAFTAGSTRQALHYMQEVSSSGLFRMYDFGAMGNRKRYGSVQPPRYNLTKITAPVNLIYSDGDWATPYQNVDRLCMELSNCTLNYKVPQLEFNHSDFLFSKDVVRLIFEKIFYILKKFNK